MARSFRWITSRFHWNLGLAVCFLSLRFLNKILQGRITSASMIRSETSNRSHFKLWISKDEKTLKIEECSEYPSYKNTCSKIYPWLHQWEDCIFTDPWMVDFQTRSSFWILHPFKDWLAWYWSQDRCLLWNVGGMVWAKCFAIATCVTISWKNVHNICCCAKISTVVIGKFWTYTQWLTDWRC